MASTRLTKNLTSDCRAPASAAAHLSAVVVQGGDFTHGNGMGGESIYGAKFPVRTAVPGLNKSSGKARRFSRIWKIDVFWRALSRDVHCHLTPVNSPQGRLLRCEGCGRPLCVYGDQSR